MAMNQREMALLDKQFAYLRPLPRQGRWHLAVTVAIFIAGIGAGSLLALRDPNAAHGAATNGLPKILASYEAHRSKL